MLRSGFDFADRCSNRFLSRGYGFCPERTIGLSLGFQPQDTLTIGPRPHKALGVRHSAFVLVLERCCLEQRRVNPIRSASPELHPHGGLAVLKGRQKFVEDLVRQPGRKTPVYRHLQGGRPFHPYLGLKPQAQSYSPFGTKNSIRSKYLSTFSKPHQPAKSCHQRKHRAGHFVRQSRLRVP